MKKFRGFTLLEVLLAMMIVVILTATMSSTISAAFKLKNSAERAVESTRDTQIVGSIFVQDLGAVVMPSPISSYIYDPTVAGPPAEASSSTGATGAAAAASTTYAAALTAAGSTSTTSFYLAGPFEGQSNLVQFFTSVRDPKDPTQLDIRYEEFGLSQQTGGTMALVRRTNTNLLSDAVAVNNDLQSGLTEEPLVLNVLSVEFQYFDGSNWTNTWDSTQIMPDTTFSGGTMGQPLTNGLPTGDSTATTGTTGAATTAPPANSTGIALPVAVSMKLTVAGAQPGDPPRVITRFASILCAIPAADDVTAIGSAGQFGSGTGTFGN